MASTQGNQSGSFSLNSIPVWVPACLTIVFMLLPWLEIPYADVVNMGGAMFGAGPVLQKNYSIWDAYSLMRLVSYDASSGIDMTAIYAFMAAYGVSIALIVAGIFLNKKLMRFGAIAAVLVAAIWMFEVLSTSSSLREMAYGYEVIALTPWPAVTVVAAILTAIRAGGGGSVNVSAIPSIAWHDRGSTGGTGGTGSTGGIGSRGVGATPSNRPTPIITTDKIAASYTCPHCGATVSVSVPNQECSVKITCGFCHNSFTANVHPRR